MTNVVTSKIDWFQAVFVNRSFSYVLFDFIGLEPMTFDPSFLQSFNRYLGYDTQFGWSYNGISLSGHLREMEQRGLCETSDVFNANLAKVQLSISGSGLDYLRQQGIDVNEFCRRIPELDDNGQPVWHPTRVDFAFDFVNFSEDLYSRCSRFLHDEYSDYGYVKTNGSCRPIKYSVRSGGERTIYLGSARSDRLLRIYDKKLEQLDRSGILKYTPIDDDITNWTRIELQVRNGNAYNLLYGSSDFSDILRFIYDNYVFVTLDNKRVDFFDDYISRDSLGSIIQNANYMRPRADRESKEIQFRKFRRLLVAFIAAYGYDYVNTEVEKFLRSTYTDDVYGRYLCKQLAQDIAVLTDYKVPFSALPGAEVFSINSHQAFRLKKGGIV